MKSSIFILKTEVKQGRGNFILIACISFLLGVSLNLALQARQKISDIAIKEVWDADLAVLPKGVGLEDFRKELVQAHSTEFIPEALFDTTVSLAEGQFKLSAVLAITDSQGSRIMQKGGDLGLGWLKGKQKFTDWQPQSLYQTPEWGTKVISGFFASGTRAAMENLKQLIDKKTVAQAIWIQNQLDADDKTQNELRMALMVFSGVLLLMAVLSFTSIFIWLKFRLVNTFSVMDELGLASQNKRAVVGGMALIFVILPVILGFLAAL